MKFFLILFIFLYSLNADIKILDTYELKSKDIHELSALAYDGKTLYALSDYGVLHHFKLKIKNNKIKIIKPIKSYKLKNKNYIRLKKKKRDSEGLVYLNNKLYISFERKPRVEQYSLNGIKIKKIKIPKILRDIKNYKSKNKALESLAYSDKYGFITAPEEPFKDKNIHKLYTTKNKIFSFKASGLITDIVFIDTDNILVLQRDWCSLKFKLTITLTKVNLANCNQNMCQSEILRTLTNHKDNFIDNYEGLTKIDKNLFLMVSDDNNNILQKTYFMLFSHGKSRLRAF